jgi:integrase
MIRPNCTPEWYAQRFEGGRKRLTKLGNFPDLTLSAAREKFKDGKWNAPRGASVAELFEDYADALQSQGKRSAEDVRKTLTRVAAAIGNKPANQVATGDIIAAIRPIYQSGKASMADHMRGFVRSAYSWAMKAESDYRNDAAKRYHIAGNPAASIPTESKVAGERWLTVDELRTFWHWLEHGGERNPNRNINPLAYTALRMIAVTGQRVEEITRLNRSMVNWRVMALEWPTTKPGRPHVMPMSTQVAVGLQAIYPNERGLYLPVRDHTLRVVVGRFCAQSGVPHFTPRDLRRTWKTLAGQIGITKQDRDRLQNHAQGDVSSKHYDRYDYLLEKRAAVLKWGRWFEATIEKKPR